MIRRTWLLRWFKSTPNRTFLVFPICIVAFELIVHRGVLTFHPVGVVLLLWGYLQYRLTGVYRMRHGGGGPGLNIRPKQIVIDGPYRVVRNPMYLGHLIFMLGLAVTFSSWLAATVLIFHMVWFHRRVLGDEARLREHFGAPYVAYQTRVKRWIPGLF